MPFRNTLRIDEGFIMKLLCYLIQKSVHVALAAAWICKRPCTAAAFCKHWLL